jgi:chitinase
MPTLFYYFGLQILFYANDHEPIHVHVKNGDGEAKFQVSPVIVLIENYGLKNKDLKLAEITIEENRDIIIGRWKEYFKDKK